MGSRGCVGDRFGPEIFLVWFRSSLRDWEPCRWSSQMPLDPVEPKPIRGLLIAVPSGDDFKPYATLPKVYRWLKMVSPESAARKLITARYGQHPEGADHGCDCTRRELLKTIQQWVAGASDHADLPHLFYFHGHGARVRFPNDASEIAQRATYFLECEKNEEGRENGILDLELSGWMHDLYEICHNVTVIIDSCHSAQIVKSVKSAQAMPGWVRDALEAAKQTPVSADSHPDIVRLTGSSSAQQSLARRGIGQFTRILTEELMKLKHDYRRTNWTMLAHIVRQRIIDSSSRETQWVSLAGPSDRLLFGQSDDPAPPSPRGVGLVHFKGHDWIRAGTLTGVEPGDRWTPLGRLIENGNFKRFKQAEVMPDLDPNRACLGPSQGDVPVFAVLARVQSPLPVYFSAPPVGARDLNETTWLCAGGSDASEHVSVSGKTLELTDNEGRWAPVSVPNTQAGYDDLIEVLEDRARVRRLLGSARALAPDSPINPPMTFEVGIEDESLDLGVKNELEPGQALWIRIENDTEEPGKNEIRSTWFTALVFVDAYGRPELLNAAQPDGIELGPKEVEYVGCRLGGARRGVKLDWPKHLPDPNQPRPVELVFIFSERPIQLGHLAKPLVGSDPAAFHRQGLNPPRRDRDKVPKSRPTPPDKSLATTNAWGFATVELTLNCPKDQQNG